MIIIASALAAVLPMAVYMFLIWKFDRYDREPFRLILQNYLWGAIGAIIFALIGGTIISIILSVFTKNVNQLAHLNTIIVAPFVEEFTKGIFLFITIKNMKFDNMTDGIVYGGAIGLGFGMTENFLYFITFGTTVSGWITIVIIRTLFSAVMHCVSTATLGAFIGYAKFNVKKNRILFAIIGFIVAVFIHFMWNLTVSFQSTAIIGFIFLLITIFIFIAVFSASVLKEKKIIFTELLPETEHSLMPKNHPEILSSAKRNKPGWIDESIRSDYVRAATTLAFRKVEERNSKGKSKEYYKMEIENYRSFIKNLLDGIPKEVV